MHTETCSLPIQEITGYERSPQTESSLLLLAGCPLRFRPQHSIAVDSRGNLFTSDGWELSASGKLSWFSARTANGQVFAGGVGIAVDGGDDLFVVSGNDVLELELFRVHRELK